MAHAQPALGHLTWLEVVQIEPRTAPCVRASHNTAHTSPLYLRCTSALFGLYLASGESAGGCVGRCELHGRERSVVLDPARRRRSAHQSGHARPHDVHSRATDDGHAEPQVLIRARARVLPDGLSCQ
eukprot:6212453-Pleurochrysis_carterae.AAC.4